MMKKVGKRVTSRRPKISSKSISISDWRGAFGTDRSFAACCSYDNYLLVHGGVRVSGDPALLAPFDNWLTQNEMASLPMRQLQLVGIENMSAFYKSKNVCNTLWCTPCVHVTVV